MKIISVRKGFTADHSSTSYEFLAIDKPLDKEARNDVSSLSSRAHPSRRRVDFVYNVEGYDIPGGWKPLMEDYYDVMYSESYGWWTFCIAFDLNSKEQEEKLLKYDFRGVEDLGTDIRIEDGRAVITIYSRLDASYIAPQNENWDIFDDENLEYEADDYLLTILSAIRKQIMDGNYDALYSVWKEYGLELGEKEKSEEFLVPKLANYDRSNPLIKTFSAMLNCPF